MSVKKENSMAISKSDSKRKTPKMATQARIVSAEERYSMIAKAAYYRAEQRSLQDAVADWLAAEKEIDKRLARGADVTPSGSRQTRT